KAPLAGGAPTVVAYQGEVRTGGSPYTGDGYFKFAVVNAAGTTSYWSNDGTSSGGGAPSASVQLAVSEGLFSALLGDTSVAGMTQPLTAEVFSQPDRYLRVWFSTSGGGPFDLLAPDTPIAAVPYALQAQGAVDADTVDGWHASQLTAQYDNLVVVAKAWGDYASVQSAINSITDASAGNPYLVWVAPGVYVEQVTMKAHVHLQGAGQEATIIHSSASSGDWPPTQATLAMASDTSLRDLTVSNNGTGTRNVALMAADAQNARLADVTARTDGSGLLNYALFLSGSSTDVTLKATTALGENGTGSNYGLFNVLDAAAGLHGGSFTGRGGIDAYGIYNYGSDTKLEAESVTALAENGSNHNRGLLNEAGAAVTLRGGSFTARGGTSTYGIHTSGSNTTLEAESVTALAEDGSNDNHGLLNSDDAATTLHGGAFTASGGEIATGIHNYGSSATLETESVAALGTDGSVDNYGLYNWAATATLRGGFSIGRGGSDAYGVYNSAVGAMLATESVTVLGENGIGTNYGLCNSM
ncbi:MAG: pectinesterase family protein, partial [Anaerolineae bacterium]